MQTASKIVKGNSAAYGMILKLAAMSQWFQFEPYPDDCYEITVKAEIAHLLDQTSNIEVVEQVATYDDNGCFMDNVPMLDAHIVANDEQVIIDMAQPDVRWQDGPRLYLERRMDQWRCYVQADGGDAKALLCINDDTSVGVETF